MLTCRDILLIITVMVLLIFLFIVGCEPIISPFSQSSIKNRDKN